MLSPIRAMRTATGAPELPRVQGLEALYNFGFLPRRGQVMMVAGESGALKSFFALWFVEGMRIPALYFSADNDAHTTISRLAAMKTGYPTKSVTDGMDSGGAAFFEDAIAESHIQFCFDSSPSLDDLADEIAAYVELWDRYPEVIAIDNLVNVEAYSDDEWAGMRQIMKELHRMARETGSAVIILHHTQQQDKTNEPPPKKALMGKVHQLPEKILTIAFDPVEQCSKIASVKDRNGPCDPSGKTYIRLQAHPDRATFSPWMGANYHHVEA